MVMNKAMFVQTHVARRHRRLGVAEAKMRLSELLRDTTVGPTIIHSRGRDVAVVLAVEDYDRLTAEFGGLVRGGGAQFLDRVEARKAHHGRGGEDFEPQRLDLTLESPFARGRQTKR